MSKDSEQQYFLETSYSCNLDAHTGDVVHDNDSFEIDELRLSTSNRDCCLDGSNEFVLYNLKSEDDSTDIRAKSIP